MARRLLLMWYNTLSGSGESFLKSEKIALDAVIRGLSRVGLGPHITIVTENPCYQLESWIINIINAQVWKIKQTGDTVIYSDIVRMFTLRTSVWIRKNPQRKALMEKYRNKPQEEQQRIESGKTSSNSQVLPKKSRTKPTQPLLYKKAWKGKTQFTQRGKRKEVRLSLPEDEDHPDTRRLE